MERVGVVGVRWILARPLVGLGAVALDQLEEDGGDVVLAAGAVGRVDQAVRRAAEVGAEAADHLLDRGAVDEGRQAVAAEQHDVARLGLERERVDGDLRIGTERTRDHRALGMDLRLGR